MSVPTTPVAPGATLHCHVIQVRTALMIVGFLIPAFGLMALLVGALLWPDDTLLSRALVGAGVLMLVAGWPLVRRSMLPMLATLTAEGLRLEPRDRSLVYGQLPVTYLLSDLTGYSELASQGGTQIKLYPAAGPLLQLADRPTRAVPVADAGLRDVVSVLTLGQEVRRRLEQAPAAPGETTGADRPAAAIYRPNFYQGKLGRGLAWLCYALMALGVGLLLLPGVEWGVGLRLLAFSSLYIGVYRRNQRPAPVVAPPETGK
jgi:hypothetical protein